MICSNFCFKKEQNQKNYNIQIFKRIPKKDINLQGTIKNHLRYDKEFSLDLSMTTKLLQFVNNKPVSTIPYEQEQLSQINKQKHENVVKKVLKSEYQQLLLKYSNTTEKFIDKSFPAEPISIGTSTKFKNIKWKRISEFIKNPKFIRNTISPQDVLQGQLGNCYFFSALSALSENDFRIKNIFPSLQINKNGIYMARILHRGVFKQVIVDDYFPVNTNNYPLFARPTKNNQIWVMILQKCWAKLFGSYQNTISGYPNQALHAFSAAPTFYHKISNDKKENNQLFQSIYNISQQGGVMCCGTISQEKIKQLGLIVDHAYTILQVKYKPFKLLKIRNPWGEISWKGRANNNDKEFWRNFTKQQINQIDFNNIGNSGTFFILWEDFVKYFRMIDVCKVNDNANYLFVQEKFGKEKGKLFQFQLQQSGKLTIGVSQTNLRGNIKKQEGQISYSKAIVIIGKICHKNQVKIVSYQYVSSNSGKSFPDFYLQLPNLQKGNYKIYTQFQWINREEDEAVVSVYTQSQIILKQKSSSQIEARSFLYQVYTDFSFNNISSIQYLKKDPVQFVSYDLLINNCGYGYIVFHLSQKSKRKLGLQFSQNQYLLKKLKLLFPYEGKGDFKLIVQPGKTVTILYKITDRLRNYPPTFTLPIPKIIALSK